jgi:hypothetical protein
MIMGVLIVNVGITLEKIKNVFQWKQAASNIQEEFAWDVLKTLD